MQKIPYKVTKIRVNWFFVFRPPFFAEKRKIEKKRKKIFCFGSTHTEYYNCLCNFFQKVCNCDHHNWDHLEIIDGSNDQSSQIGKLSGNVGSFSISSTGNSLLIKFRSNIDDDGSTGFIATIQYSNPHFDIK